MIAKTIIFACLALVAAVVGLFFWGNSNDARWGNFVVHLTEGDVGAAFDEINGANRSDDDDQESENEEPVLADFPVERLLTDQNGRQFNGKLLACDGESVAVERLADRVVFVIQLAELSDVDREFIAGYHTSQRSVIDAHLKAFRTRDRVAQWHYLLGNAQKEAAKYELPILLIFFGGSWSSMSQSFEKNVMDSKEFDEFANQNLALLKINVEPKAVNLRGDDLALLNRLKIKKVPAAVLLEPDGTLIAQLRFGYDSAKTFADAVTRKLKNVKTLRGEAR